MVSALVKQEGVKVQSSPAAHLLNGCHCDDEEERQSTGDGTGGSVDD